MPRILSKKTLGKKLDKAWSKAILSKGKCEVCGMTLILNGHHIEGRRNYRLRWDLRNGVCLCSGCHVFRKESAHQSPEWFHLWLEKNRPDDLEYVMSVRNEISKLSIDDMVELLDKLNSFIND